MEKIKSLIEVENMEFYAYHGCFEAERVVGNRFTVNLWVECDCTLAAQTDSVADTVSYLELFETVKEQMEIPSNILEAVAKRIADKIKEKFEAVEKGGIKISKLNPPLGGEIERVSVSLNF